MADLLPGGVLPPGEQTIDVSQTDSAQPGVTVAATPSTKPIDPNAPAKLAAQRKASDPFSGLQEVKPNDPFSGLQEVKQDAFSGLQAADSLDIKSHADLLADDNFHPGGYLSDNPDVTKNPEKLQKLLDVYRAKQKRGLEVTKVAKAAVTEAPGILGKTIKGARDLAERAITLGVQPGVNAVLNKLTGDTPEEQDAIQAEQGKEGLKAAGEIAAGTESAVTGIAQLGQQGARKLGHLFGKSIDQTNDSELLNQLYVDSEFAKTTKAVAEGKGDVVKAAGLDAETLAKNGVTLDKDAIENLSLVDPLTLVASAGAFKIVGVGGRVIATAATKVGGEAVLNGLQKVASKSIELAGRTVEGGANLGKAIADRVPAKSIGFALGAAKGGSLHAGAIGAAAGEAGKRIASESFEQLAKRGAAVADIGSQLAPAVNGPKGAALQRIADIAASPAGQVTSNAVKGAVQGAVTAAPLAAASDESQTAGALLGGGAALGAVHGTVTGAKSAVAEVVAKNYLDPHQIPYENIVSPGYGTDPKLDAVHEAAIKNLPVNDQNAVNTFREAVRAHGGEIYAQDAASYLERIKEQVIRENNGQPLTPAQEKAVQLYGETHAVFDGHVNGKPVVFLNSTAKGLPHDAGHLFQSLLDPSVQADLRKSALASYTPEQLEAFKQGYAAKLGEPDYFTKLGDEAGNAKAADELIAENFGQLFRNTPVNNLAAPRTFLQKLGQVAVNSAETLGVDLKAGRTTADLNAQPSYRLQDLLRNAAQDVLTREPKAQPAKPVAPVTPEAVKPVEPAKVEPLKPVDVKPAEVKPKEVKPAAEKPVETPKPGTDARNIRVTREQQNDFASKRAEDTGVAEAQKATEGDPETRAIVDQLAPHVDSGTAVEVEHRGIVSERGPSNPEGRTSRRATQAQGYEELANLQVENRKNAPADIVNEHQKTFVPVRFTTQGGKPTLIAMSLDKVISNVSRVVADAVSKNADSLLPYPTENGKLTDAGWRQAIDDIKSYSENQSNGYRGDGQKLLRPTTDIGVSLPAENPDFTPKTLSEGAANFANLVQGLNPPETARVQKGLTPGNVKGQLLAEVNAKQPLTPSVIKPEHVTKQAFKGFEPRTVKETNPLRNELAARGVNVRNLIEVTERLAVEDIASVKPRPDIGFKAPVTDTIRAGFLPDRVKNLDTFGKEILDASTDRWREITTEIGGLTPGAYHMGLELTDRADLQKLQAFQAEADKGFRDAVATGDLDAAYPLSTKIQFFREVYEAATGTGSAVNGLKRLAPGRTPPFAEKSVFLPGAETDKAIRSGFLPDTKPSEPSPSADIRDLAARYAKEARLDYKPARTYGQIDADLSKRLADFYDSAKSEPTDPQVKSSYDALAKEVMDQYKAMTDAGYKIEPYTGEGEPYKNSAEAVKDIRENKHLFFLQTDKAFGKEGALNSAGANPMTADSGVVINGQKLMVNDIFRAVHDFFGHGKEGYQFGPRGEFNAWRAHSEMFSPEAQGALAAETLAQNSWVNYGKHLRDARGNVLSKGQPGYLGPTERPFAEQKNLVVPSSLIEEARATAGRESKFLPGKETAVDLEVKRRTEELKKQGIPVDFRKAKEIRDSVEFDKRNGRLSIREGGKDLFFLPADELPADVDPITKAAIRTKDGEIFTGSWHGEATMNLAEAISKGESKTTIPEGYKSLSDFLETDIGSPAGFIEDGFVTKSGKFLNRAQALDHAENIKQLGTSTATRGGFRSSGVLESSEFEGNRRFLPKASDVKPRETEAQAKKRIEETDYSKYNTPEAEKPKEGNPSGWFTPKGEFVPLDTEYHEQWLANNHAKLNKNFGTKFGPESSVDDRLSAVNNGFIRIRQTNGQTNVEVNQRFWKGYAKKALEQHLLDDVQDIDKLRLTLLDDNGNPVDSATARLFDAKDPSAEVVKALGSVRASDVKPALRGPSNIQRARAFGGDFLPTENLPGLEEKGSAKEEQRVVRNRIAESRRTPEAFPLEFVKDEDGSYRLTNGKPTPVTREYDLINSPLAKEAAKGLKGVAREEAFTDALSDRMVKTYEQAAKNPEIKAGEKWYSTCRTRLSKLLGEDTKLFAELLGATSARTAVDLNFKFALEAYNQWKSGAFDELLAKYREGKANFEKGDVADYVKATKDEEPTRAAYLDWWIDKHNLTPLQSNGKKFGMNSRPVLKVLDGSWASEVKGPKTPNFTGNLTGSTFEATVDVWAARLLHRLSNEGNPKKWRILPGNETGVTDTDFYTGQKAFRKAAKKIGMNPDALQAILWFAEKDHWEKQGWTQTSMGSAKSDFNSLLADTERKPGGTLSIKKRGEPELDFGLAPENVRRK